MFMGALHRPRTISGEVFCRTQEDSERIGVSKSTLMRWINAGQLPDAGRRDRHNWRLFSESEIDSATRFAQQTHSTT